MHLEPIVRQFLTDQFIGRQREIRLAAFEQEGLTPAILLESRAGQQFTDSREFTSCRSEFFPDPGGRGFESPASFNSRCLARFHLGRENEPEPAGFTATRPIAGGTLSRVIRVAVPAILTAGIAAAGGALVGGVVGSRINNTRPPSVIPMDPPPPPPVNTDAVLAFIRRNGIFLALAFGIFAFLRSP